VTINELLQRCWQWKILDFQSEWPTGQRLPWSCVRASLYLILLAFHCVDIWWYPARSGLLHSYEGRAFNILYSYNLDRYAETWRANNDEDYIKIVIEKFANSGRSLDGHQLSISASNFVLRSLLPVFKDLVGVQTQCERHSWSGTPMSGEECSETLFPRKDFDAIVLQVVGGLQISWTSCLDEHLGLFTDSDGRPVLKLFWFVSDPGYLR